MMPLQKILDTYRATSQSEREKGSYFEELSRTYFRYEAIVNGKPALEWVMGELLPMRHEGWMILTRRLCLLFTGLALANELIWRTQSDGTWVQFRVGLFILAIVFGLLQIPFIMKNLLPTAGEPGPITPDPGI